MERLCERPGCSDPASVAYGMRPEDLVFWLDVLAGDPDPSHGVLCRRHADSMVVPRDWTLDDLRDPDLHLFRPPERSEPARRPRRRVARPEHSDQLELGIDGAEVPARDPSVAPTAPGAPAAEVDRVGDREDDGVDPADDVIAVGDAGGDRAHDVVRTGDDDIERGRGAEVDRARDVVRDADDEDENEDEPAESWTPSFDHGDDLDGLLSARSPLLARAFRGDDRPRSS